MSSFDPFGLVSKSPTFTDQSTSIKSLTPALRYYRKPHALSGSYFEFYGRFRSDETNYNWKKETSEGIVSLNAKENIYLIGILYGIQIIHKNGFSLDFWIGGLGIGVNSYNATSKFKPTINGASMSDNFEQNYNADMKAIYNRRRMTWENNEMNLRGTKFALSPRLLGLNLGWAF